MEGHTTFSDFLTTTELPPNQVIWFCADIAKGLLFLWNNCVVHCDLTLENIWLSENGIPVISNFGSAEIVNEKGFVESQRMKKNKSTLAPEVQNATSDLVDCSKQPSWELGIICYVLATLEQPFPDQTTQFSSVHLQTLENLKFPKKYVDVVNNLLNSDLSNRIELKEALDILEEMC